MNKTVQFNEAKTCALDDIRIMLAVTNEQLKPQDYFHLEVATEFGVISCSLSEKDNGRGNAKIPMIYGYRRTGMDLELNSESFTINGVEYHNLKVEAYWLTDGRNELHIFAKFNKYKPKEFLKDAPSDAARTKMYTALQAPMEKAYKKLAPLFAQYEENLTVLEVQSKLATLKRGLEEL